MKNIQLSNFVTEGNFQALSAYLAPFSADQLTNELSEVDSNGNTLLHDAVRASSNRQIYLPIVEYLLKCGAKTHTTNYAYQMPIALATDFEVKKLLLKERTSFSKEDADNWIRYLLLKYGEYVQPAERLRLLSFVASMITSIDINISMQNDLGKWQKILAHLTELKGSGRGIDDLEKTFTPLFLIVRIRAILEIIVETNIRLVNLSPGSRSRNDTEKKLALLLQELITSTETVHVFQANYDLWRLTDHHQKQSAVDALAVSVCRSMKTAVSAGKEYCFAVNWNQHALYVNFSEKRGTTDQIFARIDNLGLGLDGIPYNLKQLARNCSVCVRQLRTIEPVLDNSYTFFLIQPNPHSAPTELVLINSHCQPHEVQQTNDGAVIGKFTEAVYPGVKNLSNERYFDLPSLTEAQIVSVHKETRFSNWSIFTTPTHQYNNKIEVLPYTLSTQKNSLHLENYIKQLLSVTSIVDYLPQDELLRVKESLVKIYNPSSFTRENVTDEDLRFPYQVVGNCVAAAHQVGLKSRLREPNYSQFLTEELEALVRLRDLNYQSDQSSYHPESNTRLNQQLMPAYLTNKFIAQYRLTNGSTLKTLAWDKLHFNFTESSLNEQYQYKPDDVKTLLDSFLDKNLVSYKIITVNDQIQHLNAAIKKAIAQYQQLNDISSPRHLLIAIHISDDWSLLSIKYEQDNMSQPVIHFFAPCNNTPTILNAIKNSFTGENPDNEDSSVVAIHNVTERDFAAIPKDSGPWIVEMAQKLERGQTLDSNTLIKTIRAKHAILITTNEGDLVNYGHLLARFSDTTRQILISAPAGYGKSRFCQHLIERSTDPALTSYRKLFWVKLRYAGHLLRTEPQDDTIRILTEMLIIAARLHSDKTISWWHRDSIANSLRHEKVLFMFDGVDELTSEQQSNFNKLVIKLKESQYSLMHCLITTRPQFARYFTDMPFYRIQPLKPNDYNHFIDCFFEATPGKSTELKQLIQQRTAWQQLVATPFNLELLCNLLLDYGIKQNFPKTLTEIYRQVFNLLLTRAYLKRHSGMSGEREEAVIGYYEKVTRCMEELAFELICKGVYRTETLTAEVREKVNRYREDINDIGLLHLHDDLVEYMHQSFCEFLCAQYIMKNLHKNKRVKQIFAEHKYNPKYIRIWSLVAGLMSLDKPQYLVIFWQILSEKSWDLLGTQYISLLMACLDESRFNPQTPRLEELKALIVSCWRYIEPILMGQFSNNWQHQSLISAFALRPNLRDYINELDLYSMFIKTSQKSKLLSQLQLFSLDEKLFSFLLTEMHSNAQLESLDNILEVFETTQVFPEQLERLVLQLSTMKERLSAYSISSFGHERNVIHRIIHIMVKNKSDNNVIRTLKSWGDFEQYPAQDGQCPLIALAALRVLVADEQISNAEKRDLCLKAIRKFKVATIELQEIIISLKDYEKNEDEIVEFITRQECYPDIWKKMRRLSNTNERKLLLKLASTATEQPGAPSRHNPRQWVERRIFALRVMDERGHFSLDLKALFAAIYMANHDGSKYNQEAAKSILREGGMSNKTVALLIHELFQRSYLQMPFQFLHSDTSSSIKKSIEFILDNPNSITIEAMDTIESTRIIQCINYLWNTQQPLSQGFQLQPQNYYTFLERARNICSVAVPAPRSQEHPSTATVTSAQIPLAPFGWSTTPFPYHNASVNMTVTELTKLPPEKLLFGQASLQNLVEVFLITKNDGWLNKISECLQQNLINITYSIIWLPNDKIMIDNVILNPGVTYDRNVLLKLKRYLQEHFISSYLPDYASFLSENESRTLDELYSIATFFKGSNSQQNKDIHVGLAGADQQKVTASAIPAGKSLEPLNLRGSTEKSLRKFPIVGLSYQSIPGDGHCLYHAVALHVGQDQAFLRQIVAAHLEANRANFQDFITLSQGKTLTDYIQAVRSGKEWATHIEIEILMRVLDRPIMVIGVGGNLTNPQDATRFMGEPIFVLYNGHNHYDALLLEPGYVATDVLRVSEPPRAYARGIS